MTLIEILLASSMMCVLLLAVVGLSMRERGLAANSISASTIEGDLQSLLRALERELSESRGARPRATLTTALGAGDIQSAGVNSTLGFPDRGLLLIERGSNALERVRYQSLEPGRTLFENLSRAEQCSTARDHPLGAEVLWGGLAEPLPNQSNPPADQWDGRALVRGAPLFFRGDGSGFSYRMPTDPSGGTAFLDDGDLQWGAVVEETPLLSGWSAIFFVNETSFDEQLEVYDLNRDGDQLDTFDIGQLRRRSWDTANPDRPVVDASMGPSFVVQERCNWGSDLDGDGFDDPLFIWDQDAQRLLVRLFVLARNEQADPIIRNASATIFLRNNVQE